jgi:hypothetical protein
MVERPNLNNKPPVANHNEPENTSPTQKSGTMNGRKIIPLNTKTNDLPGIRSMVSSKTVPDRPLSELNVEQKRKVG